MSVQGLAKRERLASRKQIGTLFSKSYSYGKNPLRIIWRFPDSVETDPGVKVLIAVPKRKVKLAVQRNRIKRIIREVYRCNKSELIDLLKRENVKDIYLTGMQTQICIMTTAADANFRGYEPVAISDCVLSTRDENKTQALEWIKKYVGDVKFLSDLSKEFKDEQGESS